MQNESTMLVIGIAFFVLQIISIFAQVQLFEIKNSLHRLEQRANRKDPS